MGKRGYKDLAPEEKTVVDAFEGEKEYNKVVAAKDYYLFDSNKLNLLEEKQHRKQFFKYLHMAVTKGCHMFKQ